MRKANCAVIIFFAICVFMVSSSMAVCAVQPSTCIDPHDCMIMTESGIQYCSGHYFDQPVRVMIVDIDQDGNDSFHYETIATIHWRFACRKQYGVVTNSVLSLNYPSITLNSSLINTYHVTLGSIVPPAVSAVTTGNGFSISILGGSFVMGYDSIIDHSNPAATAPVVTHVEPTFVFHFNGTYTYNSSCQ